jgi:acyl phosphate:glycerol-3-phosphate acyltransferase
MDITLIYRLLIILAGYLIGAFPTAYIIYKIKKGGDIRDHGSGNVGGTNLLRTASSSLGIITMAIDLIKGVIPIIILNIFFPKDPVLFLFVSIAVIIGHVYPVYLRFKGGKGVATTGGLILAACIFPYLDNAVMIRIIPVIVVYLTMFLIFLIFRIVSLASLAAATISPISFFISGYSIYIVIAAIFWAVLIFITHKDNIKRLIKREEKKIKKEG